MVRLALLEMIVFLVCKTEERRVEWNSIHFCSSSRFLLCSNRFAYSALILNSSSCGGSASVAEWNSSPAESDSLSESTMSCALAGDFSARS